MAEPQKQRTVQYHCDYCQKDISSVPRIKCAECTDFDLCLDCFSVGVEIGPHKNDHKYHVMDQMSFSLFGDEWAADEELLLLEGLEMYGMGNWVDVADHVGTKSPAQCRDHYFREYLHTSPVPPLPPLPPGAASSPAIPKIDAAGYMQLRGEFDVEYDNNAENILADFNITEDDTETMREFKVKILEMYYHRLQERYRKRRFIIDNGLIDLFKKKQHKIPIKGAYTREDKELYNSLRVFLQVHTKEDHEEFIRGLVEERNLRRQIAQLRHYREMGIRTFAEAEHYDAEKRKRDSAKNLNKLRDAKHAGRSASKWLFREEDTGQAPTKEKEKSRRVTPLDISHAPGIELLSTQEREMCSALRLYPHQYMVIKEALLRECLKNGFLKRVAARQLVKIDVNKTGKIYDFLVESGWINSEPDELPGVATAATTAPAVGENTPNEERGTASGVDVEPVLAMETDKPTADSTATATPAVVQPVSAAPMEVV